jgi:hypothetical protein
MDNLGNGSVFFNGRRMDAQAFILDNVLLKSARIHAKVDRDDEDFADFFMTEADPVKVMLGQRLCTTTEECAVRETDAATGWITSGGAFQSVPPTSGFWPTGTLVNVESELKVAPDLESLFKVFGSFGIMSFDEWYTTALPLFSEKLGSLLGLADGTDFAADTSDD